MSTYENDLLFGDTNYSRLPATTMNPYAESDTDFGKMVTLGIINATNAAIQNKVNEAGASGQLVWTGNGVQFNASKNLLTLLLIGGVIYFMVK